MEDRDALVNASLSAPRGPAGGDPLRLSGRDLRLLIVLVLIGAAGFALGLHLLPLAFPEATIDFQVGRSESRAIAERFLAEQGAAVQGYRYAGAFQFDDSAKVFLERELGLEAMGTAVASTARIWTWSHRWFRPLQKEEFRVDVAASGEVVRMIHLLPDSAAGGSLDEEAARRLAEEHLARLRPQGTADLRYLGATARKLENRVDHQFTWERVDIDWKGGRYRHRVTVQGDRFGGYEEFVKVPEEWNRDYSRLRSANTAAGIVASVGFVLTFLIMIVMIFPLHRQKAIRWRFAGLLGAVGAGLSLLSSMNNLPADLFGYQTTDSFGGFVGERIIIALLQAIATGAALVVVVAAGENRYRSAFPGKLSVAGLLTRRGLRTKEFLFSAIGGLTLTGLFLAYQTTFYRIASSFGAWSPAEVPYTDLLNTAFPLAFLLYIGFFPSVSEEFLSRAFSVPLFGKFLRSRILGIILASAIWGFGHSTYPNQPFYIRGIELLIGGALVSVVMLKWNLLTLLVWHYTVDAAYSGYLLMRSGETYYVVTAALGGGMILLPILISLVAYIRTRRFADPEPLRPRVEPAPAPGPEAVTAVSLEARPAIAVAPLPRRRIGTVVAATAAALAAWLVIGSALRAVTPDPEVRVSRSEARGKAESFLRARGIDPSRFQVVTRIESWGSPESWRYVQEQDGLARVASLWPDTLSARTWRIRSFKPLDVEEARVRVDATSGRIVGFEHTIPEAESLRTLPPAAAESAAVALLASVGLSVGGLEQREAADEARPKRTDRRYAWEALEGDPRNVGEARYRLEAHVAGDLPNGMAETLRLPEEYEREREKRTFLWGIGLAVLVLSCGTILVLTLMEAFRGESRGEIPWKRLLPAGGAAAALALLATLNALPRMLQRYETSIPWGNFMVVVVVGFVMAMVIYFFLGWAGAALLRGLHPVTRGLADAASRRRMLPGAVLALLVTPIWFLLFSRIRLLLAATLPGSAPPPDLGPSAHLEALVPALSAVTSAWFGTFIGALVIASGIALLRGRARPGVAVRWGLLLLLVLGLALLPSRGAGELAVALVTGLLALALVLGLSRWVYGANPLAYAAGLYGLFAVRSVIPLIGEPDRWILGHGVAAAVVLIIPIAWLLAHKRIAVPREAGSRGAGSP